MSFLDFSASFRSVSSATQMTCTPRGGEVWHDVTSGFSRETCTKKCHRRWGATWCYIGCFVRDVFKQIRNTSPPQGVSDKLPIGVYVWFRFWSQTRILSNWHLSRIEIHDHLLRTQTSPDPSSKRPKSQSWTWKWAWVMCVYIYIYIYIHLYVYTLWYDMT